MKKVLFRFICSIVCVCFIFSSVKINVLATLITDETQKRQEEIIIDEDEYYESNEEQVNSDEELQEDICVYDEEFKISVFVDDTSITELKHAEGKEIDIVVSSNSEYEEFVVIATLYNKNGSLAHADAIFTNNDGTKSLDMKMNIPTNAEGMKLKIFIGDTMDLSQLVEPVFVYYDLENIAYEEAENSNISRFSRFISLGPVFDVSVKHNGAKVSSLKGLGGKEIIAEAINYGDAIDFMAIVTLYESNGRMIAYNKVYATGEEQTATNLLKLPENVEGMTLKVFVWNAKTSVPLTNALEIKNVPIITDRSSVTYKYDKLGRLSEITYLSGQKIKYTYDSMGNILEVIKE